MEMQLQEQVAFRLTGQAAGGLKTLDTAGLRPALLANYRDLTRLRYDFPLVLVRSGPDDGFVQSLSGIIDAVLQEVAPRGPEGERVRKHVLRLESEIRAQAAKGITGSLAALWDKAARRLGTVTEEPVEDSLNRARAALKVDGRVLDCNAATPSRFVAHAWTHCQQTRAYRMYDDLDRLIVQLSDILRANAIGSEAGRSAESLRAAVGAAHEPVFDFDVMARLLARVVAGSSLPASRLRRIQWTLSVLKAQRFFRPENRRGPDGGEAPYAFVFENCAAALDAFRERLPRMIELIKAIAVAELEIEGAYAESRHDAFFETFGEHALRPEDLNLFPDYLVCLGGESAGAADDARLWELLASGLPAKILVQTDDILEESTIGDVCFGSGGRSAQLATMALGLPHVYVVQSAGSNLLQAAERIVRGLKYRGPALFSIYSGAAASGLPPYLNAAAAMQSRAFPAFSYDPSAGPDWAARFSLDQNPQSDREWTVEELTYEDESQQRIAENVAFSFVDFVACDPRYAGHFARVPRNAWSERMAPVVECLGGKSQGEDDKVPYLLMADASDVLQRVIVDDRLILAADRCRERWRLLQEFGGIRNSHAERLLAREKKAWEDQKRQQSETFQAEPPRAEPAAASTAAPAAAVMTPANAAVEEKTPDGACIETPRCTSCDECTQINSAMFAYDTNKQAYIANPDAGPYRQLVEAAESCQVSIIHPGKPRNPNEPGLDELLERAAPFL